MSKPVVFISHVEEEAELAHILKKHLTTSFLGMVQVFDSSETVSIAAGENWLRSIDGALRSMCVELVICSRVSVDRPWVNFEAGAAWMKKVSIVPVCHTGLHPRNLPMPYCVFQAVEANQETGLDRIWGLIASQLKCDKPAAALDEVVSEVKAFEDKYAARLKYIAGYERFPNLSQEDRIIGSWEGEGHDLEVPDYPPLELNCSYQLDVALRRERGKIRGESTVHIKERNRSDKLSMELINISGDFFTFNYRLANPAANHFGIMMFHLLPSGEEMSGYFLTNKGFEARLATGVVKFRRKVSTT